MLIVESRVFNIVLIIVGVQFNLATCFSFNYKIVKLEF